MTATAAGRARTKKQSAEGEVQRVYRLLEDWLIRAVLAPGTVLSEADLAERSKTSRTPVREACSRLAQDNWLSQIRHKGYMVAPIALRDIVELYEHRRLLECFNAERTAHSARQEQLYELRALVGVERNGKSTLEEILAANRAFHLRLAEIAGNRRIAGELGLLLKFVQRLDTLCTQTVPGWIGHVGILSAIEARKPREAARAMGEHIDLSRDKMVKLFSS